MIGGAINLFGSTAAGYYVGYFAGPAAVGVALLSRFIHGTWRVAVMIYVVGIAAGFALTMLALALAGIC